jgi:hypothetical protein
VIVAGVSFKRFARFDAAMSRLVTPFEPNLLK